jgi:Carboxypeptidase regulatory-like domain/TonB dependent receptor-like, beta-barrel
MNRFRAYAVVLSLFAGAGLLATHARAQAIYGSIYGTVTDTTGAVIPGATITVTDVSKGTSVTATSNGTGDFTVDHLIPDIYDLKVTAKGFKDFETTGIQVLAGTAPRISPKLEVGAAAQTVTVSASTVPLLQTDRSDVATIFDRQQMANLPVVDQNFTSLQLLLPGAQLLGWVHAPDENPQGSKQIQIDGQAFGGTAYELDGADNQDPILGIIVVNPATDAIGQTSITTQNYDAEEGKAVSAVVTAQTRSGTNQFHGDIYDFRTGNANLARDPYNQPSLAYTKANGQNPSIPPGLKNRMGASLGGPIIKDKMFFFANYEGQRQKVGTTATDTLPTVLATESCLGPNAKTPTPDSQGGNGCDFSEYLKQFGAAGTIYDNLSNPNPANPPTPYPHNIIPRSELGANAGPSLALLKILEPYVLARNITYTPGVGSQSGLDFNYPASGTGLFNSDQWTERVDFTLNDKTHLFERFSRFTDTLSGAVMFGAAGGPGFGLGNYGGNSQGANDSDVAGADVAISSTLLTDVRLGYLRYNVIDSKHDQGTQFAQQLGIPGINTGPSILSGSPGFFIPNVPGGTGASGSGNAQPVFGDGLQVNRCNCPLIEREDQFQIVNNWTKIIKNHSFKLGVDLRYGRNLRVPSDNDRDGLLYFGNTSSPYVGSGPTENTFATTPGGLGWATFMLGEVTSFNRYVSTSFNAKEFQKRTFFYVEDSWRATHKLTLNYGGRLDIFWPERVNGVGNGALMNLGDGYLRVAGVGGIPLNMGWSVRLLKQFSPRLGVEYQLNPKTVVRVGYGRSFDMGVFGSIFGHTVTQNLPVLANQQINQSTTITPAFGLNVGPPAYQFPTVPSSTGLLPSPGYTGGVNSKVRPNPLQFPTLDAWNLSVERSINPTMSVTVSYVGNKGTHTLSDGDGNSTNPNESTVALPGQFSVNGQSITFNNAVPSGKIVNNQTQTQKYLTRYYGGSLAACNDPNYAAGFPVDPSTGKPYTSIAAVDGDPLLQPGMCGWTNGIQYNGDNANTEYDALQITLAKRYHNGLSFTTNYVWASAFDDQSDYWTWSHSIPHARDSNVRRQQLIGYGSYDLPFGKGRTFASGANRVEDLAIGGWQLSTVLNWASGLPYTLSYNECGSNVPNGPCDPSILQGEHLKTHLSSFIPTSGGVGDRTFFTPSPLGQGVFYNPGLGNFGNAGQNTYFGPRFFNEDMSLTKDFAIWESVAAKFRFDAFNAFNHIAAGNPNGNVETGGTINGAAQGYGTGSGIGPRQLEFSMRLQF